MKQMKKESANIQIIWPLCLVGVIPLIVMGHIYQTNMGQFTWFGEEWQADFFLYYKMWAIIVVAVLMVLNTLIYRSVEGKLMRLGKKEWMEWGPILGYLILSLASTLTSKYSDMGLHGGYELFEPIWVVLGYGVIAFYAFQFMNTKKNAKLVLECLAWSALIIGLIGAFQSVGLDLFRSPFMTKILSDSVDTEIHFVFEEAYCTLYNPNYVGVYCVLMIPVLISMIMDEQKKWKKIVYGVTIITLMISLVGSMSKTGIAVLFVMLLYMLLYYRREIKAKKKLSTIFGIGALVLIVILSIWKGGELVSLLRMKAHLKQTKLENITQIRTTDSYVEMEYKGKNYKLFLNMEAELYHEFMLILDEKNELMELTFIEGENTALIPETELSVQFGYITDEDMGFIIKGIEPECVFVYKDNKYQHFIREDKIGDLDTFSIESFQPLDGYEMLFSNRGYIWGRSIPILKYHVLLGTGRDAFVRFFPNKDFFVKQQIGYGENLITKPHNIYLQIMCEDGVISGLCCFFVWILYLVRAIKKCWKKQEMSYAMIGIMVGITGFMIMGLMNDSSVAITPIFWLLLGYGMRMNKEVIE